MFLLGRAGAARAGEALFKKVAADGQIQYGGTASTSMDTNDVSRRGFVAAAGTTAAAVAASAPAAAAEEESGDGGDDGGGGGKTVPAFGAFLGDANGYEEGAVEDARGQDAVTVEVGAGGGFAFGPATVWVSPGSPLSRPAGPSLATTLWAPPSPVHSQVTSVPGSIQTKVGEKARPWLPAPTSMVTADSPRRSS